MDWEYWEYSKLGTLVLILGYRDRALAALGYGTLGALGQCHWEALGAPGNGHWSHWWHRPQTQPHPACAPPSRP